MESLNIGDGVDWAFFAGVGEPGMTFSYDYFGAGLSNVLGHDLTGLAINSETMGEFGMNLHMDYVEVFVRGEISVISGNWALEDGRNVTVNRFVAPVKDEQGRTHHVVGVVEHDWIPDVPAGSGSLMTDVGEFSLNR